MREKNSGDCACGCGGTCGCTPTNPATKKTKRKKNAQPNTREWYRRNLIVDRDVALRVLEWHGGQGTALYSFGSTAVNDYVSPSMAARAYSELEFVANKVKKKKERAELESLLGDLQNYTIFSSENTTKDAGLGDVDSGYDTYGMKLDEIDPAALGITRTSNPDRQREQYLLRGTR